jgi:hypothetical protein
MDLLAQRVLRFINGLLLNGKEHTARRCQGPDLLSKSSLHGIARRRTCSWAAWQSKI